MPVHVGKSKITQKRRLGTVEPTFKIYHSCHVRNLIKTLALVGRGRVNRARRADFARAWQQTFWYFVESAPRLCGLLARWHPFFQLQLAKRSLESLFRRRHSNRRVRRGKLAGEPCAPRNSPRFGCRPCSIGCSKLRRFAADRPFFMGKFGDAARLRADGSRRIFGRFWHSVRGRLHLWSCDYGFVQFAVAVVDCHLLFHGWRFFDDSFAAAIYSKSLIFNKKSSLWRSQMRFAFLR